MHTMFRATARRLPFLVLPVIFVWLANYLLSVLGPLSLRHGDPDYIYLFSGLSLGNLNFDIGHVDNPGTPLQILVAIVTRVVHFFSGKGTYTADMLSRPDFYLLHVIVFNHILIALCMFYTGWKSFSFTGNYFFSVLLQMSFLTGWSVFYDTSIVSPEVLIYMPVSLLIVQLLKYLYGNSGTLSIYEVLKLSLICGLGLSIKLDYFPLFFLPFFILKSWKQVAIYTFASFLAFILFAFTIIKRYLYFYRWVTGLILHSGKYGLGEKNIIDSGAFGSNIANLAGFYPLLYLSVGILVVVVLLHLIIHRKQNATKWLKLAWGVVFSVVFHTLLVSKHFGYGYMMPSVYLVPFVLFLIIYGRKLPVLTGSVVAVVFVTVLFVLFTKETTGSLEWKKPQMAEKIETSRAVRQIVADKPFLIIDKPYNFYFHESPLLFGWFFQGSYRQMYKERLEEMYPNVYVFDNGHKKFFYWGDLLTINEILELHKTVYCFVHAARQESFLDLYKNIEAGADTVGEYFNKSTGNRLYIISKP
ncbi:MAG: hypothetical protein JXB34_02565 [Bacteroidales bacterium]|nr:hypothetical protein [Bacteroidales bacterium]